MRPNLAYSMADTAAPGVTRYGLLLVTRLGRPSPSGTMSRRCPVDRLAPFQRDRDRRPEPTLNSPR